MNAASNSCVNLSVDTFNFEGLDTCCTTYAVLIEVFAKATASKLV